MREGMAVCGSAMPFATTGVDRTPLSSGKEGVDRPATAQFRMGLGGPTGGGTATGLSRVGHSQDASSGIDVAPFGRGRGN